MSHHRQAIRAAVVAALAAGGTAAGTRVHDHPYDLRTAFPALSVRTLGERQDLLDRTGAAANRTVERSLTLEVVAEVQQATGAADARDNLLGQVEAVLAAAAEANALPGVRLIVPSVCVMAEDDAGERQILVGRQQFDITYYTTAGAPGTAV